jgi:uracil DNA glycosylase superfamily protein
MSHLFDPGYGAEPFRTLCTEYPESDVYPADQFRVEWGPIFHRGRLDGSARVVVIGQDPAQHETIIRRVLVGEAGRRLQGFLTKLGITQSYAIVNTYLYSVYGSVKAKTQKDPALAAYRNRWLDALLVGSKVEGVVALGTAANAAWQTWKATPKGAAFTGAFAPITHPTEPESSSKGDKTKLAAATKKMLLNWNTNLQALAPAIKHPDTPTALVLYGDTWANGDRQPIPEADMPAGLPPWMHENDGWATRAGADALKKRRNITLTVPKGIVS